MIGSFRLPSAKAPRLQSGFVIWTISFHRFDAHFYWNSLSRDTLIYNVYTPELGVSLYTKESSIALTVIMPGFDFSNHSRNAALHARGVPLPKATSTGTTIVGCIFDGGVVVRSEIHFSTSLKRHCSQFI
jgi:hypothetical protein